MTTKSNHADTNNYRPYFSYPSQLIEVTELDQSQSFELYEIENEFNLNDDNFKSELDNDGYQNIEDSDNAVYNSCRINPYRSLAIDMENIV